MAELIAPTTAESSAWVDFTVEAGVPVSLSIKPADSASIQQAPPNAIFIVAHKTPGGKYIPQIELSSSNIAERGCVSAPGTYGVWKKASIASAGLDAD